MDCMAVSADPLTLSGSAGATCAGGGERRSAGCSNAPVVPIALALCWVLLISHPQPNRRSRSVVTGHKLGSRPHSGHSSHTHTHTLAVESGPAPVASNPSVQSIPSCPSPALANPLSAAAAALRLSTLASSSLLSRLPRSREPTSPATPSSAPQVVVVYGLRVAGYPPGRLALAVSPALGFSVPLLAGPSLSPRPT